MFSAIASSFIALITPGLQPDPTELTNSLLLRILQQDTSFGGVNPLAPISDVPTGVVRVQSILFASLSITLLVAFIAVLGKQWIMYYTRVTTFGNIVDRGKERQVKLAGFEKWGFRFVMELLPVMLQSALLLFGVALVIYLWILDVSAARVVLVVTSTGLAFYTCIAVAATIYSDCPFKTPLSVLLRKVPSRAKEFTTLPRVLSRRKATSRLTGDSSLKSSVEYMFGILTGGTNTPNHTSEDPFNGGHPGTLPNPAFWRNDPLSTSPVPEDIGASAGFWLLENSTDCSAASAVAAAFFEFQWPSHHRSATALIRLRDTYVECLRAPEFKESAHLKAVQSAAAYYVLYHTQLIWSTSNSLEVEAEKHPPDLPPDLFLHLPCDEWDGYDVFEYLLRIDDRLELTTSVRFLSYIAPYWFCGGSDSAIRSRPSRLRTLYEVIEVLKASQALNLATLTDCMFCVGAAMDFPLHPEDLIRVDKRCVPFPYTLTMALTMDSDYIVRTLKMVVEHIHGLVLARSDRHRDTKTTALEILLTLVKEATLPLVDAAWINELLKSAARGDMDDGTFTLFLKLSAQRKEKDTATPPDQDHRAQGRTVSPGTTNSEYPLFTKILQNIKTCGERQDGLQDDTVYGGLIAMRDIRQLGSFLPGLDFLETLSRAMGKNKSLRVRNAAYDVVLVARDGWLKSAELRQKLKELDLPRQLHGVAIEADRSDRQRSFLAMMEILSEDGYWHPYLRGTMDVWLSFRHEGPGQVLYILTRICELPLLEYDGPDLPPFDRFLGKLVEDEWARVPGRPVKDLTADRLEPLAEVTKRFNELSFTESERRAVLAAVEQVIQSLEERRDGGYDGTGGDIRGVIDGLLGVLRVSVQSTSRRSTFW